MTFSETYKNNFLTDAAKVYDDPDYEPSVRGLNTIYRGLLSAISTFSVGDDGKVSRDCNGVLTPVQIKTKDGAKDLLLPTRDNVRREDNDDYQFFHPLSESVVRGESLVISTLSKYITIDLNSTLLGMISAMAALISDSANIERMNTDQVKLAREIGFVDVKFRKYTESVMNAMVKKLANKEYPISLFLKPKATIKEQTYFRGCIINIDIDDLYDEDDRKFAGVKESKKGYAKKMYQVVTNILPKHNETNGYSYGSNSKTAPYFCALIGGWLNIKKRFDDIAKLYGDLGLFDEHEYSLSWSGMDDVKEPSMEKFEKAMENHHPLIPAMDGNVGSGGRAESDVASTSDKNKLMSQFMDDVEVSDRTETTTSDKQPKKESGEAEGDKINPEYLKFRKKPEENNSGFGNQSNGFGNRNSGSSFGNNQGGFGQKGFGQQNNSFGGGGSFGGGFGRGGEAPIRTRAIEASRRIQYNGPR